MPYAYKAAGLSITSELRLPDLGVLKPVDLPEELQPHTNVTIAFGPVPGALAAPVERFRHFDVAGGDALAVLPGIGRALVRGGETVAVELFDHPHKGEAPAQLLTAALLALLHQRRLFPIHGTVLRREKTRVTLAAPRNGGKSALAGALIRRGFVIDTDGTAMLSANCCADGVSDLAQHHTIAFLRWQIPRSAAPDIRHAESFAAIGRLRALVREPGLIGAMDNEPAFMECASRFLSGARCIDVMRPMKEASAEAGILDKVATQLDTRSPAR